MKSFIEINDNLITENGVDSIIDFYRTIAIDHLQAHGLNAFVTGVDSSSLNVVIDSRIDGEFTLEIIDAMSSFFSKHKVPWSWFITASSRKNEIEKHGFSLSYESPAMYFDLSIVLPTIEGSMVTINEVKDDLMEWIQPLQEAYESTDNCECYRKLNAGLIEKGERKLRQFTAYYDNEAVASATLFLSDKAVMLHNLATKNKFRRRGIGTELTLHLLKEAKNAGYRHCYLDSSDEAINLYASLGFKIYSVTSEYVINEAEKYGKSA